MGEQHIIEYKRIWKDEWLAWICGFANADGGSLYLGVADDGSATGLQNPKKLMEDIPNKIANKLGLYPDVRLESIDGKDVIIIVVHPSIEPVTLDGVLYKRVGATNQIIKGNALRDFYYEKQGTTWDAQIVQDATLDDINLAAVNYFISHGIDNGRISKNSVNDNVEKILKNLKVMRGDGRLTMAALLLFVKDPQQYCLNARVKIGRFGETQADLMTQDLLDGDLIRMADRVINALSSKYLIHPIHYNKMHREEPLEIPEDALREIIYNAIIHKDYTGPDSQLRVFNDRITFWNPGLLPKGYTPETLFHPHESQPRNRLLANAFYMAGFIEAWGRGYEIISKSFTNEGLSVPFIEESFGGVRITVKREIFLAIQSGGRIDPKTGRLVTSNVTQNVTQNVTKKITERQKNIYNLLPLIDSEGYSPEDIVTAPKLAARFNVTARTIKRDLKMLQEEGLIQYNGPSKGGSWVRLK